MTSGGPSAEAWCPLGGFESAWTLVTTGRMVAHVHTSRLVLTAAVLVLAVVGRGFFCGWLCPFGTLQEMVYAAGIFFGFFAFFFFFLFLFSSSVHLSDCFRSTLCHSVSKTIFYALTYFIIRFVRRPGECLQQWDIGQNDAIIA